MNEIRFPMLKNFFGAYLHQDWHLEFSSPTEAVNAFKEHSTTSSVLDTCKELDRLIAETPHLGDPGMFLWQKLMCYYDPIADGLTVQEWLEGVRTQLHK